MAQAAMRRAALAELEKAESGPMKEEGRPDVVPLDYRLPVDKPTQKEIQRQKELDAARGIVDIEEPMPGLVALADLQRGSPAAEEALDQALSTPGPSAPAPTPASADYTPEGGVGVSYKKTKTLRPLPTVPAARSLDFDALLQELEKHKGEIMGAFAAEQVAKEMTEEEQEDIYAAPEVSAAIDVPKQGKKRPPPVPERKESLGVKLQKTKNVFNKEPALPSDADKAQEQRHQADGQTVSVTAEADDELSRIYINRALVWFAEKRHRRFDDWLALPLYLKHKLLHRLFELEFPHGGYPEIVAHAARIVRFTARRRGKGASEISRASVSSSQEAQMAHTRSKGKGKSAKAIAVVAVTTKKKRGRPPKNAKVVEAVVVCAHGVHGCRLKKHHSHATDEPDAKHHSHSVLLSSSRGMFKGRHYRTLSDGGSGGDKKWVVVKMSGK